MNSKIIIQVKNYVIRPFTTLIGILDTSCWELTIDEVHIKCKQEVLVRAH